MTPEIHIVWYRIVKMRYDTTCNSVKYHVVVRRVTPEGVQNDLLAVRGVAGDFRQNFDGLRDVP